MPAPKNQLKANLQNGTQQIGCFVCLGDEVAANIAAQAGFDWLLIDGEHAPNAIRELTRQVMAVERVPVAVRLPDHDPAKMKQVLDIGVQTVMVPMVNSAAEAEALVRATRYPPAGMRGVASSIVRASGYGSISDYVATADAEICLVVQIETRAGLEALESICAVDGVDAVFIGPADLAADMGFRSLHEEEARAAAMDAVARIAAAGKIPGIMGSTADYTGAARAAGATLIAAGTDVGVLAAGLRALQAQARG